MDFSSKLKKFLGKICNKHKGSNTIDFICFKPECVESTSYFLCHKCYISHSHSDQIVKYENLLNPEIFEVMESDLLDYLEDKADHLEESKQIVNQINQMYDEMKNEIVMLLDNAKKDMIEMYLKTKHPSVMVSEFYIDSISKQKGSLTELLDEPLESTEKFNEKIKSYIDIFVEAYEHSQSYSKILDHLEEHELDSSTFKINMNEYVFHRASLKNLSKYIVTLIKDTCFPFTQLFKEKETKFKDYRDLYAEAGFEAQISTFRPSQIAILKCNRIEALPHYMDDSSSYLYRKIPMMESSNIISD